MTMLEKVARAISDAIRPGQITADHAIDAYSIVSVGNDSGVYVVECARAALRAMREPTDEMVDAAFDEFDKLEGQDWPGTVQRPIISLTAHPTRCSHSPAPSDNGGAGAPGNRPHLYGDTREELTALAALLYEEMERLDPSAPGPLSPFDSLDEDEQIFYRCCAQSIFVRIKSRSKISPTIA